MSFKGEEKVGENGMTPGNAGTLSEALSFLAIVAVIRNGSIYIKVR